MGLVGFVMLTLGEATDAAKRKLPPSRLPRGESKVFHCPRCGALPGEKCVSPTGQGTRAHNERLAVAKGAPR